MKGRAKVKRIAAAVLCVILLCSVMSASVFAKNYTSASKTISGHTLECIISYWEATSQYEAGEINVDSDWSGSDADMRLTVNTVDYYTGETTSFGNGSRHGYDTHLNYFAYVPVTGLLSIYACAEITINGSPNALYAALEGTDGTP